jgi:choline dehydrogenase-like flavoprotein
MLIDARSLPDGSRITADVVIVGSGAAGLALAGEFAGSALTVCLLESGGEESSPEVNALSAGQGRLHGPDGVQLPCDDYLVESRERSLGGTLNLWGGKCAELDGLDFEEREWIAHSGWPLDKAELQPCYARACALLGIAPFDARQRAAVPVVALNGERRFTTALRTFSDLTGKLAGEKFHRYKYAVANQPNVSTYLHANVLDLVLDEAGQALRHVVFGTLDGRRHVAQGRVFVLAAGGLENPRLLLNADSQQRGGLGNAHDQVGRCFAGHGLLRFLAGNDQPPAVVEYAPGAAQRLGLYLDKDPRAVQGIFTLSRAAQRRDALAGFSATLEPVVQQDGKDYSPVYFSIEQQPDRESRLSLGAQRDALGLRRLVMDWRFNAADRDSFARAVALFAAELEQAGIGRLHYDADALRFVEVLETARHHIGATRMSDDPREGVVDRDCRVHGTANLYVAGASVFPTSGLANPTLTIVALALRLADRLKSQLRERGGVATSREWAGAA